MTDINNPADVEHPETEATKVEEKTFEQLEAELIQARDSLEKVKANRDEILREKRAKSEAKSEVQDELDALKGANSNLETSFKEYIHNQAVDSFIKDISLPGSEALWKSLLNEHVQVDVVAKKFDYIDKDGNTLTRDALVGQFAETHAQFMKGPDSSGGGALGSGTFTGKNSSRVKSKQSYANSFGIGK